MFSHKKSIFSNKVKLVRWTILFLRPKTLNKKKDSNPKKIINQRISKKIFMQQMLFPSNLQQMFWGVTFFEAFIFLFRWKKKWWWKMIKIIFSRLIFCWRVKKTIFLFFSNIHDIFVRLFFQLKDGQKFLNFDKKPNIRIWTHFLFFILLKKMMV